MINKKEFIKSIIMIIVILFFGLYFSYVSGYYQTTLNRKTNLTEEAIQRFEDDVKNGVDIKAENYLKKDVQYNNKMSILGLKISNVIESSFNKIISKMFDEINSSINK